MKAVGIMKKVLVTGGTGLVGNALQAIIENEQPSDEEWFFAGSKDADLTLVNFVCTSQYLA